jgi:signal transduction histidine kinase/CheY-like chemotaxis protein
MDTEKAFKVLIVEEDYVLGVLLERTLKNSGFITHRVYNGTQALDFCKTQSPEETFLLLDQTFTDMTAEDIVNRLKQQEQPFPYTILSGRCGPGTPVKIFKHESANFSIESEQSLESLTRVLSLALEKAQQMLYTTHHAMMSADYGIVIAEMSDENCPIIYHNLAFEIITGYHCSDSPTLNEWLDSYDPHQPGFNKIWMAVHDQKSIQIQLKGRNQSLGWHDIILSFIREASGPDSSTQAVSEQEGVCIGIITNGTEQYLTNQKIASFRQQLAQSQRIAVATHVAKELTHEIGRPLTQMSSKIQLMLNNDTIEKEDLLPILSHLDQITDLLKAYSCGGGEIITPTSVSIPALLQSILNLCPCSDDIFISVDASDNLPEIIADMGKIAQVLLNFINNAVEACEDGGTIVLSANVTTPAEKDREYAAISVKDTGCGIEPDQLQKIFDPFYTTKAAYPSRGLGLSICQYIAKLHDGWIEVQSQPGKGACFTLMLPLSPSPAYAWQVADDPHVYNE